MKKRIKKLLKIGMYISGIFILVIGLYARYVFSDWNQDIDKEKVKLVISEIKATKEHDEKLITMYNTVHKNALEKSSLRNLWDWIWGDYNECPCLNVSRMLYINKRHKLTENSFAVSVRIEKEVSQRDCLNYILEEHDYFYANKGVDRAAEFYFKKPVYKLSDDELIGLIIMQKNPILYNPIMRTKTFNKKVGEIKEKIKKTKANNM